MKILHTADWHLGQRFCDRERKDEHHYFLNWLLQTIENQKIDALLISGDVFDVSSPPNSALKQYYDFLKEAAQICRNIIITGGNHDSPNTLNAPKELMKTFNIHIIGGNSDNDYPVEPEFKLKEQIDASAKIKKQIIEIKNSNNRIIGAVAAIPFLREGDVRFSTIGENFNEKMQRYQEGVKKHYQLAYETIKEYKQKTFPVIAMGHLFVNGASTSDNEKELHIIGNQGQMPHTIFPPGFDYIALGHIHRPQIIAKQSHIRYCGSPIPLSFSERNDDKQVIIVQFEFGKIVDLVPLKIPLQRQLKRFKGSFAEIQEQLQNFLKPSNQLSTWAEIHLQTNSPQFEYESTIREMATKAGIEILKFPHPSSLYQTYADSKNADEYINLDLLNQPIEIFKELCKSKNVAQEQYPALEQTFYELLNMTENK